MARLHRPLTILFFSLFLWLVIIPRDIHDSEDELEFGKERSSIKLGLNFGVDIDPGGSLQSRALTPVSTYSPKLPINFLANKVLSHYQNTSTHSSMPPPIYMLWSRWRTGSSFLGKLMAHAKERIFYSYEPLHIFGTYVLREDDKRTAYALRFLKTVMKCDYTGFDYIFHYLIGDIFYLPFNPMTSSFCQPKSKCNHTEVMNDLCLSAKLQIIKVLRLSLKYAEQILESNPALKIIYLARDPRPILKSRSRLLWCLAKDCHDPERVCDLLLQDFQYAEGLTKKFPNRFMLTRYEDLAAEPHKIFRNLWESFLEEQWNDNINDLINQHTQNDTELGTFGLKRNSKKNVYFWRKSLDYKSLQKYQSKCVTVIKKLGYRQFISEEEYDNYNISSVITDYVPFLNSNDVSLE